MTGLLLMSGLVLALFLLGATASVAPSSLMRYHHLPRSLGLTTGARRALTRAAGVALLLLSLWFAWVLFGAAA